MPDQTIVARNRTRRTVLTLTAAAFVVLVPTACDYAVASTGSSGAGYGATQGGGQSGNGGAAPVTEIETVPAGTVQTLDPTPSADETAPDVPDASAPGSGDPGSGAVATGAPDDVDEPGAPDTGGIENSAAATSVPPADVPATGAPATGAPVPSAGVSGSAGATTTAPAPPPPATGLAILGQDCTSSELEPHDGFQKAPRCVAIAFGEVAAAAQSPSLLITEAPETVASGVNFTLTVSTRNLIRDRFLGAAAGGYYRESSFLNADGLQRGHFHTACRMLDSTDVAPDAAPVPAFFLATQDNGGGAAPDQVVIPVTGLKGTGTAQCAVWAGDGSHRVPMMERANQTPAFDVVRITVG